MTHFFRIMVGLMAVIGLSVFSGCAGETGRRPVRFRSTPGGETAPAVLQLVDELKRSSNPAVRLDAFFRTYRGRLPVINNGSVTFAYRGKPGVPVAVVGDFNGWHRLKDVMREVSGTGFHYLSLRLPHADTGGVHYMYARNCRKISDYVNDPLNRVVSFRKACYASWAVPSGYKGGRHIIVHNAFSAGLQQKVKPKRVIAWLPPSYFVQKRKRYPVLYMHDEQNIWTGKGMAWGGWQVDSIAARLIRAKKIRECIIVGLPHAGKDRIPEYSPPYPLAESVPGKGSPGWGDRYLTYLLSVKKHMDTHFRTKPDRRNTAVAGSSMGGLISWYIAWMQPDVFGTAGCFSPWFIFRYEDLKGGRLDFGRLIARGPKTAVRYYIDCGDSGWAKDGIAGTLIALRALKKAGWREGRDLKFVLEKGAVHNEKAWNRRFPEFLRWAFPR